MKLHYIIYVAILWLSANAIFPLIIDSVERLYQKQIDKAVSATFQYARWLVLMLVKSFLVVLFFPSIVIVNAMEKLLPPGIFRIRLFAENQRLAHFLLSRHFWATRRQKMGGSVSATLPAFSTSQVQAINTKRHLNQVQYYDFMPASGR